MKLKESNVIESSGLGEKITDLREISAGDRLAISGAPYHKEINHIITMPGRDVRIPRIEKFFLRQNLQRWMREGKLFKLKPIK